jgi:hypothetical protein
MGLTTTHNAWSGPYSSFNDFRYGVAAIIGINLDEYKDYRGSGTKEISSIDHPLVELFRASDCEGELNPEQCKKIYDALNAVLAEHKPKDVDEEWLHAKMIQFRNGCRLAYGRNEVMEFC